jgi:hypothetical protein
MMFRCDQNHLFHYPAKQTVASTKQPPTNPEEAFEVAVNSFEVQVCPFCQSKTFTEEKDADVANVLVVELTTGPQIAIDKALSEGYKVVGRYAKQYILEKPKEEIVP